jgi:hypothetical protein
MPDELGVTGKVWETLTEIDRLVFKGERRHDGKNGGAHVGQFAVKIGRHG